MAKIIIDGNQIEAASTDTILTAATRAGIDIPHFCYHPELQYAGSCRMCMVELEKSPKLVTSCTTLAAEGMIVHTDTERVKKARAAVLEFLLINHPLDCPICDKAGECPLQDNYFKFSAGDSRYEEQKWHKRKKADLGPTIVHDEERCILCTRCVRFMQDIAKSPQLVVTRRGSKNTLSTYPGAPLDNPYSLNTVDICPVGALTSKDFRFKCRTWYLKSSKSLCPFCETGCNTIIQHMDGCVYRILPDKNEKVNGAFMCDQGRLFRKHISCADRVSAPVVKCNKNDATSTSAEESFDKIFAAVAEKSAAILKKDGPGAFGVLLSPYLSVEEAYLALKIFGETLKTPDIALINYGEGFDGFTFSDDYLISKDKSPNKAGISALAEAMNIKLAAPETIAANAESKKNRSVIFIGPSFGIKEFYDRHKKAIDTSDFVISLTTHFQNIASISDYIIPFLLWAESEGHFVNKNGLVQKFLPAVTPPGGAASPGNIETLRRLGACFNAKFEYRSAAEVFAEIKKRLKLFD